MRILSAFILIAVISLTTFAQTPSAPAPPQQPGIPAGPPAYYPDSPTRVFAIRYVDARAIERLLQTFSVPVSRESSLNALTVKAPEKTLTAIEEIIKQIGRAH